MTTRGFTLYQLTALARTMHSQGHSGIDCTVTDDIDQALGDTHDSHPIWEEWTREYHALVAQPVRESPVCPECLNVHPVTYAIPSRAMGGTWVMGANVTECGVCGYRIAYRPCEPYVF